MNDKAEEKVSRFYNTLGWSTEDGITEDARRWEDLRKYSVEYVGKCRLRVLRHIPVEGKNVLDMASGPIQYIEYLEYSINFQKRYCVDLSLSALEQAKKRIGDHGVYLHGSFLNLNMVSDFFDCAVSLHTIYHIDKDQQEAAVRKLVDVVKPGKPVIIVYSNPNVFYANTLRRVKHILGARGKQETQAEDAGLYFHAHPIGWWQRYRDVAEMQILPWRSLTSNAQKKLIPDNRIGQAMLRALFYLEDRFPNFFVNHFQYPMIVLTKKVS